VTVGSPTVLAGLTAVNNGNEITSAQASTLLKMRIEQVKIPGIALLTADIERYGVGPTQKMPLNAAFVDTSFTFLADKNGSLWNFWYQWMLAIVNFSGTVNNTAGSVINDTATYLVRYKDDCVVPITITMYSQDGKVAQTIQLSDAYPVSMNDIQVGWGEEDAMVKVTVGITFKEMVITNAGTSTGVTTA
jgi:hypothetical protein